MRLVEKELQEGRLVLVVNHAITEHALVFMDPEFNNTLFVSACLEISCTYALENLAHIAQVERIVTLIRSRLERLLYFVINVLCRVNNFIYVLANFRTEVSKEPIKNFLENHLDRFCSQIRVIQDVVMAL